MNLIESAVDMFRKVSYHKLVIADHSTYSHVTYARATPEKVWYIVLYLLVLL